MTTQVEEAIEQETPEVPFETALVIAIGSLPTPEAQEAAQAVVEGSVEVPGFTTEQVITNLQSAGYTPEKVAQALAVAGLRHSVQMAWWKAGQASGLGTPGKERSGGTGARSRYNALIGKAGAPGSVATSHAPGVSRKRKAEEQEPEAQEAPEITGLIFTHKGGGFYEAEDGTTVKGKKNLPEGAQVA